MVRGIRGLCGIGALQKYFRLFRIKKNPRLSLQAKKVSPLCKTFVQLIQLDYEAI